MGASGASHKPLRLNCGRAEVLRESAVSWRSRTHSSSWSPHEASRARRERDAAGPCARRGQRGRALSLPRGARRSKQPAVGRLSGFKFRATFCAIGVAAAPAPNNTECPGARLALRHDDRRARQASMICILSGQHHQSTYFSRARRKSASRRLLIRCVHASLPASRCQASSQRSCVTLLANESASVRTTGFPMIACKLPHWSAVARGGRRLQRQPQGQWLARSASTFRRWKNSTKGKTIILGFGQTLHPPIGGS